MKKYLNEAGISLVEVLVVLGILGIATLATLSLQKTNIDVQRQNQLINTAQLLQTRFRNLLTDNQAFEMTTQKNASMNCLVSNPLGDCTGKGGTFDIYDASGATPVYKSLTSATSAGNGFTATGAPCTTFSPDGNNDCPLGYVVTWEPQCSGTCVNPPIKIIAQLIYKPGPNNSSPLNPEKYSIGTPDPFIRSAKAVTLSFKLVHASTGPGGNCGTGGAYTSRPLAKPANGDTFNLVSVSGTVATLSKEGTYKCSGSAVGFAVDGFTTRLMVDGVSVGEGAGFAPKWLQAHASIETVFTVTKSAPKKVEFQQTCSAAPGAGVDNLALGMPVPPYVEASTYATLVCSLLN